MARFTPSTASVVSGALLVLVSAMAGGYSVSRHRVSLDSSVSPPGWRIRFRLPSDYAPYRSSELSDNELVFSRGDPPTQLLMVERDTDPHGRTPRQVAQVCFRLQDRRGLEALLTPPPDISDTSFGPLPGALLDDASHGIIIAATVIHGEAYCLTHRSPPPAGVRDLRIVESVLKSVETVEPSMTSRP